MEALAVLSVEGKAKEGLRVLVFGVSVKFLCESLFLGDVLRNLSKLALLCLVVVSPLAWVEVGVGQPEFTAYVGSLVSDEQIDGVIGSEWDDAGKYLNASIFGNRTADVWMKHDNENLYLAYRFQADSNDPWTAVELTRNGCMVPNVDGALFGHNEFSADGYQDMYFVGIGSVRMDSVQDGKGVIAVDSSNVVAVELKKPLDSGDTAGFDMAWSAGRSYGFRIMWDSNGDGSSGGRMGHQVTGEELTLFLSPEAVPELPSVVLAAFLVASIVVVAGLAFLKRTHRKNQG